MSKLLINYFFKLVLLIQLLLT